MLLKKLFSVLLNIRSWIYSVYFNFHYLPFRQAIKLPIYLHKPKLGKDLKGSICIEGPCYRKMITLGMPQTGIYPDNGIMFENHGGKIVFRGPCSIGGDSAISIGKYGYLEIDGLLVNNAACKIICFHHIHLEYNTRLGYEVMLMDTSFHRIKNSDNTFTNQGVAPIILRSYTWIGTRSLILPGAETAPYTIVAANSVLNKAFNKSKVLIAGQPASIRREGIWRDFDDDNIDYESLSVLK